MDMKVMILLEVKKFRAFISGEPRFFINKKRRGTHLLFSVELGRARILNKQAHAPALANQ
jgi:hypothetical protein